MYSFKIATISIFFLGVASLIARECCSSRRSSVAKSKNSGNVGENMGGAREYVQTLYEGISGYSIPVGERDDIIGHGGEPTYGEVTPEGVSLLGKELELTSKSHFYDLGGGVGKIAVQLFFEYGVKKSVSIERSQTRHDCGAAVFKKLYNEKKIPSDRTLKLECGDILDRSYSDATHIYTASLCFSDEFMEQIARHLQKTGKSGLIIASLRQIPDGYGFVPIKTVIIPMSWSEDTQVFFYCLKYKRGNKK